MITGSDLRFASASSSRPSPRRLAVLAVASCAVAVAVGTTGQTAQAASRVVHTAPDGADVAGRAVKAKPLASGSTTLQGTVTRLFLDAESTTSAAVPATSDEPHGVATWVIGDTERVQVPGDALTGVTTGSLVKVTLGGASQGRAGARQVRSVQVLQAADPAADPTPATGTGTGTGGKAGTTSQRSAASTGGTTRSGSATGTATTTATTASAHTATLVLVRPAGAAADSMTVSALKTRLAEASTFWNAQTRGRVTFTASKVYTNSATADWLTTTYGCSDYYAMWNEVAAKVGFTLTTRNHLILYVPSTVTTCNSGLGTVGSGIDSGGYLYVKGNMTALVAHELGHNMSLGHSNGLQCNAKADGTGTRNSNGSVTWTNGCVTQPYRDWYDVMGVSWGPLGSLSSFHARHLGVVPATQLLTVTAPTRFVLAPVGATSGLVSVQVKDPAGIVYTVEYRPASGADSWLTGNPRGLVPGVLVHRADPAGDGGPSLLLDASPSATSAWADDWAEPIAPSASLVTGSGRTKLTVTSQTSSQAAVTVTMDGVAPAAASGVSQPRAAQEVQAAATAGTAVRVRAGAPAVSVSRTSATPHPYGQVARAVVAVN